MLVQSHQQGQQCEVCYTWRTLSFGAVFSTPDLQNTPHLLEVATRQWQSCMTSCVVNDCQTLLHSCQWHVWQCTMKNSILMTCQLLLYLGVWRACVLCRHLSLLRNVTCSEYQLSLLFLSFFSPVFFDPAYCLSFLAASWRCFMMSRLRVSRGVIV